MELPHYSPLKRRVFLFRLHRFDSKRWLNLIRKVPEQGQDISGADELMQIAEIWTSRHIFSIYQYCA